MKEKIQQRSQKEPYKQAPSGWVYYSSPTPRYRKQVSPVLDKHRRWAHGRRQILAIILVFGTLFVALIVLIYSGSLQQTPWIVLIAASLAVVATLIAVGYRYSWTGFGDKTLWSWLQLLIIPVFLAAGGYLFTAEQHNSDSEIEENRAQDNAVQSYIDQMSLLVIDKNLHDSQKGDQVRTVARARTATVLNRLGRTRKQHILQFLNDSDLITKDNAAVDLSYDHLEGARLTNKNLSHLQLSRTYLNNADLSNASLRDTDLSNANLSGADLTNADLTDATLIGAKGVTNEQLEAEAKSLEGATMPDGSQHD